MNFKRVIREGLNQFGLDVVRTPRPVKAVKRDGLAYYETPIGKYYLPLNAMDDGIARHMRTGRVFEPEVVEVARRYIKPRTAAIDVGSNYGQMAILFAEMGAHVYAIEAQEPVYQILCKNIEANKAHVTPVFVAAHNKSGDTFLFPKPDFVRWATFGSYNLPLESEEGDPVQSQRIDELEIDSPVSFMKVDVQGFDLFALQGATKLIEKHKMPILFEFEQRFQEEYKTDFQDYVDFVDAIGYKFAETIRDINYLIVPR